MPQHITTGVAKLRYIDETLGSLHLASHLQILMRQDGASLERYRLMCRTSLR